MTLVSPTTGLSCMLIWVPALLPYPVKFTLATPDLAAVPAAFVASVVLGVLVPVSTSTTAVPESLVLNGTRSKVTFQPPSAPDGSGREILELNLPLPRWEKVTLPVVLPAKVKSAGLTRRL